jgi:hypothetical protein
MSGPRSQRQDPNLDDAAEAPQGSQGSPGSSPEPAERREGGPTGAFRHSFAASTWGKLPERPSDTNVQGVAAEPKGTTDHREEEPRMPRRRHGACGPGNTALTRWQAKICETWYGTGHCAKGNRCEFFHVPGGRAPDDRRGNQQEAPRPELRTLRGKHLGERGAAKQAAEGKRMPPMAYPGGKEEPEHSQDHERGVEESEEHWEERHHDWMRTSGIHPEDGVATTTPRTPPKTKWPNLRYKAADYTPPRGPAPRHAPWPPPQILQRRDAGFAESWRSTSAASGPWTQTSWPWLVPVDESAETTRTTEANRAERQNPFAECDDVLAALREELFWQESGN